MQYACAADLLWWFVVGEGGEFEKKINICVRD